MAINFASASTERLVFDGSNITVANQLSFSIWIRTQTASTCRVMMINDTGEGFQVAMNFFGAQKIEVVGSNTVGNWGDVAARRRVTNVTDNEWSHVCGTVAATSSGTKDIVSAFVNGVAMGASGNAAGAGTQNGEVWIAARSDASSYFNGDLAEAAIWDGPEITLEHAGALFAGMPVTSIFPEELAFYTPMHEADGVDLITGNSPTVSGTPDTDEHAPVSSLVTPISVITKAAAEPVAPGAQTIVIITT